MRITKYKLSLSESRILQLVKESSSNYQAEDLSSPAKITDMMQALYNVDSLPEEHVWLLTLSQHGKPSGIFEVSHGGMVTAPADIAAIFQRVLLTGSPHFVLMHNHPSGDSAPSKADIELTKQVKQASKILGIMFLDHLIFGDSTFSFRASDIL